MKASIRIVPLGLLAAVLALPLMACKPIDKESGKALTTGTVAAADLSTDKEQVSWVIGTQIGESLAEVQEEVELDMVIRAIRARVDGQEAVFDAETSNQIMMGFGERMQQRQIAKIAEQAAANAEEGRKFFAENGKKPEVKTTGSGLQYQVLGEGSGARPAADATVKVHYRGTLLSGETFDDSYARGEPAQFALNQVVPGWQEGLQLMPVGSKYRFWIPGELGYGEQGTPGGPIAPNATLVFEVELLEIVNPAQ